jgi:hypothetical protein
MLRLQSLGFGLTLLLSCTSQLGPARAQTGSEANLAEQLSNPVSSLISVPFQFNYDTRIGPEREGDQFYLNFQPVVPIPLDKDWNLISRTILPIVRQNEIFPGADSQSGLGDTLQSFFLSPKAPGPGGIIWGVGPALLLPTATDRLLGSGKWAAGPTAVVLSQKSGWTVGILANHVWSYAGDDDRTQVNSTFLQPFIAYTTKDAWTYTLNSESSYDWVADQWSVPVNAFITKLMKIGDQPISIGAGVRYWAETPTTGAHDLGVRMIVTFLFPTEQKSKQP